MRFDGKTGRLISVEMYDAQAAYVQMGKHHKLWDDWEDIDVDQEIAKLLGMVGVYPREEWGPIIDTVARLRTERDPQLNQAADESRKTLK